MVSYIFGKFTISENKSVERKLRQAMVTLCEVFETYSKELDLVLLIGGYGKSEGGIKKLNGVESAKNNIDLLIFPKINVSKEFYLEVEAIKEKLLNELNIEIDESYKELDWLENSKSLIAYEAKKGYKCLFKCPSVGLKNIVNNSNINQVNESEFNDLVVNRAVLLKLNHYYFSSNSLFSEEKVKIHICKAIIGLGDYLLYKSGKYSTSYVEKHSRIMKQFKGTKLSKMYDMAFRYRAYDNYELFNNGVYEANKMAEDLFVECLGQLKEKVIEKQSFWHLPRNMFLLFFKYKIYRKYLIGENKLMTFLKVNLGDALNREFLSLFFDNNRNMERLLPVWAEQRDPALLNKVAL